MVRHPISRDITVNFSPSVISDCDIVSKSGAGDAGGSVFHRILSVNQNAAAPPAPPLCCSRVVIALYSFSGITSTFNP